MSVANDETRKSRAEEKEGETGWYCCEFASYCVYGDKNKKKGAKNWLTFGSSTNKADEAVVIVAKNGSHVGVIVDGGETVWHAPGANSGKPIKSYTFDNFTTYVINDYVLRK